MAGRADGSKSRFGGEPSAHGYVKNAHTWRNVSCTQQERHEVHRNVREGPVVLCRRLIFEAEFRWHPRFCLFCSESKGPVRATSGHHPVHAQQHQTRRY